MALEQRLTVKIAQQLRMTPQLRQAIKILQLSKPELETMIADELCQNPVLEEQEASDAKAEELGTRTGDAEKSETEAAPAAQEQQTTEAESISQVDWEEYVERQSNDFHGSVGAGSDRDDDRMRLFENTAAPDGGLSEMLTDQLALLMMNEQERRLATLVCLNLDEEGYLACNVEEIAAMGESTVEAVNEAREIVQELEPPGCGSVDLRECLLLQLRLLGYESDDYVVLVADRHLKDLESKRYSRIAKDLGTTTDEIVECHKILRTLDPKPGHAYSVNDTRYIAPDAYILRIDDDFLVVLNDEGLPRLQLSPQYANLLAAGQDNRTAKSYLQDKHRSAVWLMRSIEQRQRTLRKVTESIVRFQRKFLVHGVSQLKPMVLRDVANDIGMHESTVSRATANKYVHTPQGLFELKYFFTSSLRGTDGCDVSSESVKQKILTMIEAENPRKPISDQFISVQLKEQGIDIARRTVAKYRESMNILPSSKRRRVVELD